jgi:hypothetical protein
MSGRTTTALATALCGVALLAGAARALPPGVPDIGSRCDACHQTGSWRVLPEAVDFDHAATGFALYGRHAAATCRDCHGQRLVARDAPGDCAGCHDDPHRGAQGIACEDCHSPRGWSQSSAWLRHRETRFPLVGTHAAADCTACHTDAREPRYRGTPTDCYSCHADDFLRPGIHPDHVAAGFRTTCESCHSQYLWFPARIRHDLYWPLRGAHAGADCFSCHAGSRYGGTPTACAECHQADYQAAQEPPHAAWGISQQCEGCHTDLGWSPARLFWHEPLFPITKGDHAGFACAQCHPAGAAPAANFTCVACHRAASTAAEHGRIAGYAWEDFACLGCHPDGEE